MAINYYDQERKSKLKDKRALNAYLKTVIAEHLPEVKKIDINYIFMSDDELIKINVDFLDHDTYTDIITFDLSEYEDHLQSDIYISVDRIEENAKQFGVSYERELHRVLFHGVLHLCGFKDKTPEDEQLMREMEDKCLAAYLK